MSAVAWAESVTAGTTPASGAERPARGHRLERRRVREEAGRQAHRDDPDDRPARLAHRGILRAGGDPAARWVRSARRAPCRSRTWWGRAGRSTRRTPRGSSAACVDWSRRRGPRATSPRSPASLTHVAGEHLGRFDDGIASLDALAARPACPAGSAEAKLVGRQKAALLFAAGRAAGRRGAASRAPAPTRSRPRPIACGRSPSPPRRSPGCGGPRRPATCSRRRSPSRRTAPRRRTRPRKALAITGNNLATELENRSALDATETALMLRAAQAGLDFWKVAGTWLEEGRAEYRLSSSLRKAGDASAALRHAERYLAIVDAARGGRQRALLRLRGARPSPPRHGGPSRRSARPRCGRRAAPLRQRPLLEGVPRAGPRRARRRARLAGVTRPNALTSSRASPSTASTRTGTGRRAS